jgi:hypothetical protein
MTGHGNLLFVPGCRRLFAVGGLEICLDAGGVAFLKFSEYMPTALIPFSISQQEVNR